MSTWEERMAARAKERQRREHVAPDPEAVSAPCMACGHVGCLPNTRLCQECMDRPYGTPGPVNDGCQQCWGERLSWLGNCWGYQSHLPLEQSRCAWGRPYIVGSDIHSCHEDEIWLAGPAEAVG
jgi:hypothetical protein